MSRTFERAHGAVASGFARGLTDFLGGVADDIAAKIKAAGSTAVIADDLFKPADYAAEFARVITPHLARGLSAGIAFERDWIESAGLKAEQSLGPIVTQAEDVLPPPSFVVELTPEQEESLRAFLKSRQVGLWKKVGKTTGGQLRKAIAVGLREGDNLDDLTARVNGRMKRYKKWEAERVARTETTAAMNTSAQIEREEIGITSKAWLTSIDERTRESHLVADGQSRKNDKPFRVGGDSLMYPGDASLGAPAGQLVNCRCVSVASFEDDAPSPVPSREPDYRKPQIVCPGQQNYQWLTGRVVRQNNHRGCRVFESTPSDKAARAKATHKTSTAEKQRHAEANEGKIAKKIGGKQSDNNKAMDVTVKEAKVEHGIELKTMLDNGNDKITMHPQSRVRKQAWERGIEVKTEELIDPKARAKMESRLAKVAPKNRVAHTVVVDDRDVFDGGANAAQYSGNKLYYRRGVGAFRVGGMHAAKDSKELKQLITAKLEDLPAKALPPGWKRNKAGKLIGPKK